MDLLSSWVETKISLLTPAFAVYTNRLFRGGHDAETVEE